MASSDFEASEYDLGTTSVRLIRAGNVVQAIFSNRMDARVVYADLASRFKRESERLR
jgi:hypothetical protein